MTRGFSTAAKFVEPDELALAVGDAEQPGIGDRIGDQHGQHDQRRQRRTDSPVCASHRALQLDRGVAIVRSGRDASTRHGNAMLPELGALRRARGAKRSACRAAPGSPRWPGPSPPARSGRRAGCAGCRRNRPGVICTQFLWIGTGRPCGSIALKLARIGSSKRGSFIAETRAGKVSVKKPWFSDVLRNCRNFFASSGFLASFGNDEAPAAEDRRGLLALGMRDHHHADVDLGVLLADRGDVELAGLVGRHRVGDEQAAVGGAVVLQRRGRRQAVLVEVGVEGDRLDRRRLVDDRRLQVVRDDAAAVHPDEGQRAEDGVADLAAAGDGEAEAGRPWSAPCAAVDQLVPGLRRIVRIEPGRLEVRLVVDAPPCVSMR